MQRANIVTTCQLVVRLPGRLPGRVGHQRAIGIQLRIQQLDTVQDRPGQFNGRDRFIPHRLDHLCRRQETELLVQVTSPLPAADYLRPGTPNVIAAQKLSQSASSGSEQRRR